MFWGLQCCIGFQRISGVRVGLQASGLKPLGLVSKGLAPLNWESVVWESSRVAGSTLPSKSLLFSHNLPSFASLRESNPPQASKHPYL